MLLAVAQRPGDLLNAQWKGQPAAVSAGRRQRSRRDGNVPFVMWQLIRRLLTRWARETCSVAAWLRGTFLLTHAHILCVRVHTCTCACAFSSSPCTVYLPPKSQLFCSSERKAVFLAPCHSLSSINSTQSLCIFLQVFLLSLFALRKNRLAVGALAKPGFMRWKTFDLSVYTFVYFSWQNVKAGGGGKTP